jgi:hypothetical protein
MKDALAIFGCFILIFLTGFSVTALSLLTTKHQVTWLHTNNGSFSNFTVAGEGDGGLWSWQLLRDVLEWGIWKVFGQVDEPENGSVSGMDKVVSIVDVGE